MALIYFAVTLFISAFLLFLVQPMIGKMILPQLGGTPQVWNTCMMFFQIVLLAGYAYTHTVTTKLSTKKQLIVHCFMLLLPLPVLLAFGRPFYVAGFGAEGGGNPVFLTLGLLTMIVGIPFLVVSTTAPLLQRWFNKTGHPASKDPYFLYGASNLGSILGLLLYPVGVEMFMTLPQQAYFWLYAYIALALLVGGCALFVIKAPPSAQIPGDGSNEPEPPLAEMPVPPEAPSTAVTADPPVPAALRSTNIRRGGKQRGARGGRGPISQPVDKGAARINIKKTAEEIDEEKPYEITPLRRLRWVGLAAVPTSLMLGLTTYISTDISPVPLLWIIPLTLYLLSFVFVFARWPVPWVGVGRNHKGPTPHKAMVVLQLIAIPLLMLVIMAGGGFYIPQIQNTILRWTAFALVYYGPFFVTALVCHGELARDRPPPHQLTEFYLWMSVGGMLGGTFNALIAPLIPWFGLFEFPLALVLAAWVRPGAKGSNWTDFLFEGMPKEQADGLRYLLDFVLAALLLGFFWILISAASETEGFLRWRVLEPRDIEAGLNPLFNFTNKTLGLKDATAYSVTRTLSILLTYGVGIGLALLTWKRPIRLALCLGAVLLANAFYTNSADRGTLHRDRSYFGILRVLEMDAVRTLKSPTGQMERRRDYRYTYLMHGTTHHGLNFSYPDGSNGSLDVTRLATTYYHRDCPVGVVMEALNWFPGYKTDGKDGDMRNTYWADARLPATLIGNGVPNLGVNLPMAELVAAWSEPAYATIGLGTGTMASYARPFQHMTFFEIDEHIRNYSLPPPGREMYFNYLQNALKRGTKLEVVMGDARFTMDKERENEKGTYYLDDFSKAADRQVQVPWKTYTSFPKHENYYRAIEVDAFSSDAIPVHLITKQAIKMYMDKLTYNGVLCVHTSNRHVNLVLPVIKICEELDWEMNYMEDVDDPDNPGQKMRKSKHESGNGLAWVICKDGGGDDRGLNLAEPSRSGHFGSEYILVARKQEYLPPYTLTEDQMKAYKDAGAYVMAQTAYQQELYESKGLKLYSKNPDHKLHGSTIEFFKPDSYNDRKMNRMVQLRNGQTMSNMDLHDYVPSPSLRTWTDDYSNIWSVFRW